jgi:alkylation response protein AidB-like acyl-CoA dehydrogenase
MNTFFWWTDTQKELFREVTELAESLRPRDEESWWKKEFPWDIVQEITKRGYYGATIAKKYGGLELGVTGAVICTEALCRLSSGIGIYVAEMLGGVHQIESFGSEVQKTEWLSRIARGELGAIAVTEPFAGTDTAEIGTTAQRDGARYILTGKKRYVTATGVASHYLLYARTSDDPQSVAKYKHLSCFVVQKGMPGFTVERINELIGLDNVPNGYLNLDEVPVPLENRIGEEGEGWRIMMSGFNFERIICSAVGLAGMYEALRTAVPYAQRRIQFGMPTIEMTNNQFKVADIMARLELGRLATYYTSYLVDKGESAAVQASMSKLFCSDMLMETAQDASSIMGGDGANRSYPVERLLRDAKIHQIAGGTPEAMKLLIYRMGLRQMKDELQMPHRLIHPGLGVPVPASAPMHKEHKADKDQVLKLLAEDYRVNPGLYMARNDLKAYFDVVDEELDGVLQALEKDKLVKLYRRKGRIELAKATYEGLRRMHPPEYYRWLPGWVKEENVF